MTCMRRFYNGWIFFKKTNKKNQPLNSAGIIHVFICLFVYLLAGQAPKVILLLQGSLWTSVEAYKERFICFL